MTQDNSTSTSADALADQEQFQTIAAQLRKPHGKDGIEVGNMMNEGNRDINIAAISALEIKASESVLEIGMGNGFFASIIVESAVEVSYTGLDYSTEMIEQAAKLNAKWIEQGKVSFYEGDIKSIPFANDAFDTVFTVNTIYFWDDSAKAISEIHRVLKPGGKVVLGLRPEHAMKDYPFTKFGFEFWSKEKVVGFLENNGFVVEKVIEEVEKGQASLLGATLNVEHLIVSAAKPVR